MTDDAANARVGKVNSKLVTYRWTSVEYDEIAGRSLLKIAYTRPRQEEEERLIQDAIGMPVYELVYVDEGQARELLQAAVARKEYGNAKLLDEALKQMNSPREIRVLSGAAGSLRLVIPTEVASYMNVRLGDRISFSVQGGKVLIRPAREERPT